MIKILLLILSFQALAQLNWDSRKLGEHLGYKNYYEQSVLTEDEKDAIMFYTFTDEVDYQDINGYLRFGNDYDMYNQTEQSVQKLIGRIKSSANKLPRIPKDLIVYRGFKLSWRNDKCFSVGETLSDKAFMSTTLSKRTARHFAFRMNAGKGVFLTLKLNKTLKGILITENDEAEVLLMPGRVVKITEAYEENGECYASGVVN